MNEDDDNNVESSKTSEDVDVNSSNNPPNHNKDNETNGHDDDDSLDVKESLSSGKVDNIPSASDQNDKNDDDDDDTMDVEEENKVLPMEAILSNDMDKFNQDVYEEDDHTPIIVADPLLDALESIHNNKDDLTQENPLEILNALRDDLASRLCTISAHDRTRGQELWRRFDALSSDLSTRLCEQLRLILEPSLATKLKGDYRSGKRINMKKIISFIASQYKKDKIWLRRTKPSKRTYQIIIAVDDSTSMASTQGGVMACEAMVVLAKAMTQLEVGELGVMSFGEEVKLLHPLDKPFTPEAGAKVLSQFTFAQERTKYADAIASTISVLNLARANMRGKSDQLQLIFIISDGLIDDSSRERVKRLAREASERGQMLVMLLLDFNDTKGKGVLDMQQVKYVDGKIQFIRYMDEYPFHYYMVLNDMKKLPECLGDALRQFIQLSLM